MLQKVMLGTFGLALALAACTPVPAATLSAAQPATSTSTVTVKPSPTPTSTSTATAIATATVTPTSTPLPSPTVTASPLPTAAPLPTVTRPPPTATPQPEPSPAPVEVGSEEQHVIELVNQIRREHGLFTLTVDARLMAAAKGHSLDMAQNDFFSHAGSDGSSVEDRLARQGYAWTFYAEDLACGYDSSAAAVQGWMDSPAHRDNLLAQPARQVGVGFVNDQGGNCRAYWTITLAAERQRRYPGEGRYDTAD